MEILSLKNVSKRFGATVALDNVSLSINQGEVVGLAGENGAGKSTLIKLLCGVYKQEAGRFLFKDKTLKPRNPYDAEELGISVFHQEIPICPNLSVSANVFLGKDIPAHGVLPNWKFMREKTRELFLDLLNEEINPDKLIKDCSVAERQLSLFVRVLSKNAQLIILDEPTTALTIPEVRKLFAIINRLKKKNITFLFVSHLLDELVELSDRICVMRDGKNVGELVRTEFDTARLSKMIAGRELGINRRMAKAVSADTVLSVRNLSTSSGLKNITFSLHKGEVLGLAGLQGSGKGYVARALFGLERITGGEISVLGKSVRLLSPRHAIHQKIGYVPEDRNVLGLFKHMDIKNNIYIAQIDHAGMLFGLLDFRKIRETAESMKSKLDIRMQNIDASLLSLSGGNQQKVLISRWLSIRPQILVMNEPTRGVDVGAKEEICKLISELTDEGYSFLVASSELEELMEMSDRILVMYKGEIAAAVSKDEFSKDILILTSTSGTKEEDKQEI